MLSTENQRGERLQTYFSQGSLSKRAGEREMNPELVRRGGTPIAKFFSQEIAVHKE